MTYKNKFSEVIFFFKYIFETAYTLPNYDTLANYEHNGNVVPTRTCYDSDEGNRKYTIL